MPTTLHPYMSQTVTHVSTRRFSMTNQLSFTKHEHKILPNFRQKINTAESSEDLKKFFVYTATELFEDIFTDKIKFSYDDIALMPETPPHYVLHKRLLDSEIFTSVWNNSDLPRLISHLAESTMNHYKRLAKNPEKAEKKIRR